MGVVGSIYRFTIRSAPGILVALFLSGLLVESPARAQPPDKAADAALRSRVAALAEIKTPPAIYPVDDASAGSSTPRRLYFDGLPYRGRPTRVFAWYGAPKLNGEKAPAVILLHGGGGSAYRAWVEKWNQHGFVAIAPALEGQTDEHEADGKRWKRHAWAGPARAGIYEDMGEPLEDQWMYHAVADAVQAHALLRLQPEVDVKHIGVAGISWGGVVTSTLVGIDPDLAFAVPIYGCGFLAQADNQWGLALGKNHLYQEVWEPGLRLPRATLPILWLTFLYDTHFPLDSQQRSYRAAPGPRMVAVLPNMQHGHTAGWNPEDSYAFAESVVRQGKPWLRQLDERRDGDQLVVRFASDKPIERAVLIHTADSGYTGRRRWSEAPATFDRRGETVEVRASLPANARAYFVNVHAGSLVASSEYAELPR